MGFKLLPRNESFFPIFIEAAENIEQGAIRLKKLVDGRLDDADKISKQIKEIEVKGDGYTHQIVEKVYKSFVTPFDREDIHELAEGLDDILDEILNVADLLVLHKVDEENEYLIDLAKILVKSCEQVTKLTYKLEKLKNVDETLEKLGDYRRKARKVYRNSVSHLFSGELKSFDVLKLKDINEALNDAIHRADHVGEIVEAITLKHS